MQQHWKRLADGVELAVTQTDKFKKIGRAHV